MTIVNADVSDATVEFGEEHPAAVYARGRAGFLSAVPGPVGEDRVEAPRAVRTCPVPAPESPAAR